MAPATFTATGIVGLVVTNQIMMRLAQPPKLAGLIVGVGSASLDTPLHIPIGQCSPLPKRPGDLIVERLEQILEWCPCVSLNETSAGIPGTSRRSDNLRTSSSGSETRTT